MRPFHTSGFYTTVILVIAYYYCSSVALSYHLEQETHLESHAVNVVTGRINTFQNGHKWYYLSGQTLGADEASDFCAGKGLQLLRIESEEEGNIVIEHLRKRVGLGNVWISDNKTRNRRETQDEINYSLQDEAQFTILQQRPKNCSRCRCKEIPECGTMPKCTIRVRPCSTQDRQCSLTDHPVCTILRGNCSSTCPCTVDTPSCSIISPPRCTVVPGNCETTRPKCKTLPKPCKVVTRKVDCKTKPNLACRNGGCEDVRQPCYDADEPCYDDWEKCDDRRGGCPRRVCPPPRRICPPSKTSCHPLISCSPVVCQSPLMICEEPNTHCPAPVTKCTPSKVVCGEPEVHCPEPKLTCPDNMRGRRDCGASVACPSVVTHCTKPKLRCSAPVVRCEPPSLHCEPPPPCPLPTLPPMPDPECPPGYEDCCERPMTLPTVTPTKEMYYHARPTEVTRKTTRRPTITTTTTTSPCPTSCPTTPHPTCPTWPCSPYNPYTCPPCPRYNQYPYAWPNGYGYGQVPNAQPTHFQSDEPIQNIEPNVMKPPCTILSKDKGYRRDVSSCQSKNYFVCESQD